MKRAKLSTCMREREKKFCMEVEGGGEGGGVNFSVWHFSKSDCWLIVVVVVGRQRLCLLCTRGGGRAKTVGPLSFFAIASAADLKKSLRREGDGGGKNVTEFGESRDAGLQKLALFFFFKDFWPETKTCLCKCNKTLWKGPEILY